MLKRGLILCLIFIFFVNCAGPRVYVPQPPPPPRQDVVISVKPHPHAVWIPGYWKWEDPHRGYVWVPGHWKRAPRGKIWVPGHWQKHTKGWVWVPGHWRKR